MALVASLTSIRAGISVAQVELVVGTVAVLPAYLIRLVVAGVFLRDRHLAHDPVVGTPVGDRQQGQSEGGPSRG